MPASSYDRGVRALDASETARPACEICGCQSARAVFEVEDIDSPIVACVGCGLGRYDPMLEAEQVRSFYPDDYYGEPGTKFRPLLERLVRAVAARHIAFLSRGLPKAGAILDVGCGRGVNLGPLADQGFRVHGLEVSERATQGCDPRAEIHIASRLSDAGFETKSFDQVVIWHVLEHIADPFGAIAQCQRILKPGGRLVVAVPNFTSWQARWSGPHWFHLDPPRHLFHFPLTALVRLVEESGFRVTSTHHFSLRQNPFGWIQSALNRFGRSATGSLYSRLHQQPDEPLGLASRLAAWALLISAAPFAIALSVVAAWMQTGATVHVVAIKTGEGAS